MIPVDVLTVLGPGRKILEPVLAALENQGDVELKHYVVDGPPRRPGESRVSAIARARNLAKWHGDSHYAMFLDDDIVLPEKGIEKLVYALVFNNRYAAIGIDCQNLHQPSSWNVHVGMGAVMFVRPILEKVQFREELGTCECYCCCEDIRGMGYLVDYLPEVQGKHLK